jgi:hypothetical protein
MNTLRGAYLISALAAVRCFALADLLCYKTGLKN